MEDPELEAIRQRRMAELQQQAQSQASQQEQAQRMEAQKQGVLRQILTPEARDRLANPQMAESVEMQLIQLAQSGRLRGVIDDTMLRNILAQIAPQRREITIERR